MNKLIYALSGYAEWFWLMAKNWKDVENRDWPLSKYIKPMDLPIRIYLHASKTKASNDELNFICDLLSPSQFAEFKTVDWLKFRGHIIGEITITNYSLMRGYMPQISPWAFGKYCFWVRSGVLYEKPIPYKGQLGFFKVDLNGVVQ